MDHQEIEAEKRELKAKGSYTFDDLRRIMAVLRDPEEGCPWDRVQTHASLKKDFQSELDEVFEGIDLFEKSGDASNLCEELGDVLMHVLLQARIAEQEGVFTTDDVIEGISEKMIRRHPHVFGEEKLASPQDVVLSWETIKKQEKAGKKP